MGDEYKSIFENSLDAILLSTSDGNSILAANPAVQKMLGYTSSELLNLDRNDLIDAESPESLLLLEERKNTGHAQGELIFKRKNGSHITCEVSSVIFTSAHGQELASTTLKDITALKKTQKDLEVSDERFRSLVDNATEALFIHDFYGNFLDVNKKAGESLGYSREELLHLGVMDVEQDFNLEEAQLEWSKIKIGEPFTLYGHHKRKDGSTFPVELRFAAIEINNEKLFMALASDITQRENAKEALKVSTEWLDFAQKAAKSGFWDWNMHTGELTWSDGLYELFGIPLNEPPSFDIWLERMHPEDRDPAMNTINQSIEEHIPLENEYRMIKPDGSEIWIRAVGETYYDSENNPYRMSGLCQDISSIKEAEKKRTESEERYHSLFDNMLNGFAYCKMIFKDDIPEDFIYIDVNDSFEKLTGLKDVSGKKVSQVIPGIKENDPQLFEIYGRVALTGKPESFEIFLESLKEWFSVSVYSPRKEYFVAVFDVITERKKAEESFKKILKREKLLGDIIRRASVAIDIGYADGSIGLFNKALEDLTGYCEEELESIDWSLDLTPEKWRQSEQEHLNEALKTKKAVTYEKEYIRKDGSLVPVELVVHPNFDDKGNLEYYFAFITDITERKKAEKKQKILSKHLQLALDASNMGWWHYNPLTDISTYDERYQEIFGVNGNQKPNEEILKILHPDDIENVWTQVEKALDPENSQPYSAEYRIFRDGEVRWIEAHGIATFEGEGNKKHAASLIGTVKDITESKKAQKDLQESKQFSEQIIKSMKDGFCSLTAEGVHLDVNQALCEMVGYSREELIGTSIPHAYWPEEEQENIKKAFINAANDHLDEKELIFKRKNGERFPVIVSPSIIRDEDGEIITVFGTFKDITERIKSNAALKESESKYRGIFDKSSSYLILISAEGILMDVNEAAVNFTGLTKEELIGRRFSELNIMPEEELPFHFEKITKAVHGEIVKPFESTAIDKNGEIHYVINSLNPLEKNGEIYAFHVICNDITDLKLAENEIVESLHDKEILLQEIHHRVKNNMQIISSILNLQSYNVTEEETKNILKDSQGRIRAMSMVHENLYRSQDLSHINFKVYVEKLVYDLLYSYKNPDDLIIANMNIEKNIELNMETTIPLGLIINELVTNSLKFAFPDGKGIINIDHKVINGNHTMIIEDDGIGFLEVDPENVSSLGLQLVHSLVNQLDGEISLESNSGAKFTLKFKEMKYKERI